MFEFFKRLGSPPSENDQVDTQPADVAAEAVDDTQVGTTSTAGSGDGVDKGSDAKAQAGQVSSDSAGGAGSEAKPAQVKASSVAPGGTQSKQEDSSKQEARQVAGSISQRMEEAGYVLPAVAAPVAAYVPAVPVYDSRGKLIQVQTSGQLPVVSGKLMATGKVGDGPNLIPQAHAYQLARIAALNALAAAAEVAGGVDRLSGVSRVGVFVASDVEFFDQARVANGASEFYGEIFDGGHSRSAVGVAVLPLNSPVEVEVMFNVR